MTLKKLISHKMIRITGKETNEKVKLNIKNIADATAKGIRAAMFEIGNDLRTTAKKSILKKPKHGRTYLIERNRTLVRHKASKPGEPPANFTGSLQKAIDFDVVGTDRIEFGVKRTLSNSSRTPRGVDYGKDLEFGTTKFLPGVTEILAGGVTRPIAAGEKDIAPRPFLLPAIKKNYRNMETRLNNQIEAHIKKGE